MASSDRRPGKKQRSPKFFKIILNPQSENLKIPVHFIKKYGLSLPSPVFLRAPRGPSFQVELTTNSDGETWLGKGWDKFKDYNSIDFGHFLVFKYDTNNSSFRVLIFDKASPEVDYPSDANNQDETMSSDSDPTDDDEKSSGNVDESASVAYQRAKAFKSDNINQDHTCFIRLMHPSYISSSFLVIPPSIIKEHFAEKVISEIKLRVCDGALWPCKCSLHAPNARIGAGWSTFAKDHNLKVGDACLFEVSKINKSIWNVFIFRR